MPKPGEKNAPTFDAERPEELGRFFERMEDWFSDEGVEDDVLKKKRIVRYLDPDSETQWKALPGFDEGTYEGFRAQVMAVYPKAEEVSRGSVTALKKRIRKLEPVAADERDELLTLIRVMTAEVKKLKMIQPPIHTNRELVELFLERLLPDFASRVANKLSVRRLVHAENPELQGAARNTEDMFTVEEVMKMANHTSLEHANPFGKYLSVAKVGEDAVNHGKLEEAVAKLTDSIDVQARQNKQMEQRLVQLQNSMTQNRQAATPNQTYNRGQAPAPPQNHVTPSPQNDGSCFYCRGPHKIIQCEGARIHLDLKWLRRIDNYLRLPNGEKIPRDPTGVKSMMEMVESLNKGMIPTAKLDKALYQGNEKRTALNQSLQTEEDAQKTLIELLQKVGPDRLRELLELQSVETVADDDDYCPNFETVQ